MLQNKVCHDTMLLMEKSYFLLLKVGGNGHEIVRFKAPTIVIRFINLFSFVGMLQWTFWSSQNMEQVETFLVVLTWHIRKQLEMV